jgi:hypothetical protein
MNHCAVETCEQKYGPATWRVSCRVYFLRLRSSALDAPPSPGARVGEGRRPRKTKTSTLKIPKKRRTQTDVTQRAGLGKNFTRRLHVVGVSVLSLRCNFFRYVCIRASRVSFLFHVLTFCCGHCLFLGGKSPGDKQSW